MQENKKLMTILYGIKNCDTVKKARDWLAKNNIPYQFHDFRTDGLDKKQVQDWIAEMGLENLINKRSTTWKALDEKTKNSLSEKNAAAIITHNPTLIKRPLLDSGNLKHLGFNEAEYKNIFK
jgi:arsenate reductase (glutaredoxin)